MCSANAQHVRARQNLLHHNQPQQKFLSSKAGQLFQRLIINYPGQNFTNLLRFFVYKMLCCTVIFLHFHGSSLVPMKCLRTLAAQALPKTTVLVGIEGISALGNGCNPKLEAWAVDFPGSQTWGVKGMTHKPTKMTNNPSSTTRCNSISKILQCLKTHITSRILLPLPPLKFNSQIPKMTSYLSRRRY